MFASNVRGRTSLLSLHEEVTSFPWLCFSPLRPGKKHQLKKPHFLSVCERKWGLKVGAGYLAGIHNGSYTYKAPIQLVSVQ